MWPWWGWTQRMLAPSSGQRPMYPRGQGPADPVISGNLRVNKPECSFNRSRCFPYCCRLARDAPWRCPRIVGFPTLHQALRQDDQGPLRRKRGLPGFSRPPRPTPRLTPASPSPAPASPSPLPTREVVHSDPQKEASLLAYRGQSVCPADAARCREGPGQPRHRAAGQEVSDTGGICVPAARAAGRARGSPPPLPQTRPSDTKKLV